MEPPLTEAQLDELAKFDAPTICNALSALRPDAGRRNVTTEKLYRPFPDRGAMVGYALTVTIRSCWPDLARGRRPICGWVRAPRSCGRAGWQNNELTFLPKMERCALMKTFWDFPRAARP